MHACLVVSNSATLQTVACQAPLSMGFSRQDNGLGCHALLQGALTTQGSNLCLLHCRRILYHCATWETVGASFLMSHSCSEISSSYYPQLKGQILVLSNKAPQEVSASHSLTPLLLVPLGFSHIDLAFFLDKAGFLSHIQMFSLLDQFYTRQKHHPCPHLFKVSAQMSLSMRHSLGTLKFLHPHFLSSMLASFFSIALYMLSLLICIRCVSLLPN